MNLRNFKKNKIWKDRFYILPIVLLSLISIILFFQKQGYKYDILYLYKAVPDINLTFNGQEIKGFVKFDEINKQPKSLRQYYIIKPTNTLDNKGRRVFSIETIIKMNMLPPSGLGTDNAYSISYLNNIDTVEDEYGNKFFIDYSNNTVNMLDLNGDKTSLITNDLDFRDFIVSWINK